MSLRTLRQAGQLADITANASTDDVSRANAEVEGTTSSFARFVQYLQTSGFTGGGVSDTAENRAALQTLLASVPVPTDAQLDALAGIALTPAQRQTIRAVYRLGQVRRYVGGYLRDRAPANDL